MSNPDAAQTGVQYNIKFDLPFTATLGSIRIEFCDNTPLYGDACNPPFGFDTSGAALATQSGSVGYLLSGSSPSNELLLIRPPGLQSAALASYEVSGITNPATAGSLFARIYTYPTSNGTGPNIDFGGLALAINPNFDVAAEVPPYLTFCIGENITNYDCTTATEPFSDLGNFSPSITSAAQHQAVVATNAADGYSLRVSGSTMTSGGSIINAMSGTAAVKGTSQFGINLRANAAPVIGQDPQGPGSATVTAGYNQPNQFRFNSGDVLASSTDPNDFKKFTISYIVDIPNGQAGGLYSTTLVYLCLANF
jgi:hypothetical protein